MGAFAPGQGRGGPANRLRLSDGTVLTIDGVASGEVLQRSGANVVGVANAVVGPGSANRISKFVGPTTIADSSLTDDGVTVTCDVDLMVTGNLTVNGTQTVINVNTFTVEDPLIEMGSGNAADLVDLGFYANYNDGTPRFTGLFRDATDGKFRLFRNLTVEPTTTVATGDPSFQSADLVVRTLESNVVTGTAPLIVSSTTLVVNLNADQVDGRNEGEFVLLGGRAGTANDFTISTTLDGTITGSANSAGAKGLVLKANPGTTSAGEFFFNNGISEVLRTFSGGTGTKSAWRFNVGDVATGAAGIETETSAFFDANSTSFRYVGVRNQNVGATADAGFRAYNSDGVSVAMQMSSAAGGTIARLFTPSSLGGGRLQIQTSGPDEIRFVTGAIQRISLLGTGEFVYGSTTTYDATAFAQFDVTADAIRRFAIRNTNVGASAKLIFELHESGGNALQITAKNAASGAFGLLPAGIGFQIVSNAGTLAVSSGGANPTIFGSAGSERYRILSSGEVTVNATALVGAERFLIRHANEDDPALLLDGNDGTVNNVAGAVTDGFNAGQRFDPEYRAAAAQTVTRHNYLDMRNPVLSNVTLTDAAVMRFDAAAGTHAALATTAGGTVAEFIKVNVNGTIRKIQLLATA